MGSFANSVFNLLLGWVRSAASTLWALITGAHTGSLFAWLGENWLALTIAIVAVCTVIDVLVHLLRWRPHKVWASFLRRLTGYDRRQAKKVREEARARANQPVVREWIYADGSARTEEVHGDLLQEEPMQPWQHLQSEEELAAYRKQFARPATQPIAYRRPAEMNQLQYQQVPVQPVVQPEPLPEYPQPETIEDMQSMPEPLPAETVNAAAEQPRESLSQHMRRRVMQLQKNLGMDDDDEIIAPYMPAKPIADEKDMYHAPVYPPNWRQGSEEAAPRRRRQNSEVDGSI